MQINFLTEFKGIQPFNLIGLPDLVVITGKNGAGKSNLLRGLTDQTIATLSTEDKEPAALESVKFYEVHALAPNSSETTFGENVNDMIRAAFRNFQESMQNSRKVSRGDPNYYDEIISNNRGNTHLAIYAHIRDRSGKSARELTQQDFWDHYPILTDVQPENFFEHRFSEIFKRYAAKWEENNYSKYKWEQGAGGNPTFVTEEQFVSRFGAPPWEVVNSILLNMNSEYCFTRPENYRLGELFTVQLVRSSDGHTVDLKDLSSGEKLMMGFIIGVYHITQAGGLPQVLLLDEPDASLHPTLAKQFLEILKTNFLIQGQTRVVMTTHSPTTVALAPEESIYVMDKETRTLRKESKDAAIRALTEGIPSLSVRVENRRQVFVENARDRFILEVICERLQSLSDLQVSVSPEISITFISSGLRNEFLPENGDSAKVAKIVKEIGDNPYIFGLIDRDENNKDNGKTHVFYGRHRYTLENFVLDPLLLGPFLLKHGMTTPTDLGLMATDSYVTLINWTRDKFQTMSNALTAYIEAQFLERNILTKEFLESQAGTHACSYLNGMIINIPKWYLNIPGHKLHDGLLNVFGRLNTMHRTGTLNFQPDNPSFLLGKIVVDLARDEPRLFAIEWAQTFKRFQDAV